MRGLVTLGGVVAVAGVIGYAAWRYNNRLVAEAVEREDWAAADAIAGHQLDLGRLGMTLALPAVIVVGLAVLASIDGPGGKLSGPPSSPSGLGYGSYL
jgi:hypothetical protein